MIKGLHLRTNFGAETGESPPGHLRAGHAGHHGNQAANLSNPILNNVDARRLNSTNLNWVWENTATYNRTFATNHNLTLLAGYAAQYNTAEGSTVSGQTGTYTNTNIRVPHGRRPGVWLRPVQHVQRADVGIWAPRLRV